MKAVLNPATNEVLGFDESMSDPQISAAIQSDQDGRPLTDVNPTFYDRHISQVIGDYAGDNSIFFLSGNSSGLAKTATRTAGEMTPVDKATYHGMTFGAMEGMSEEEKKAYPMQDFAGNLAGQSAAIMGLAGAGGALGIDALTARLGLMARGATPLTIRSLAVGSDSILPSTLGKVIQATVSGVVNSAALGGTYEGITKAVEEDKKYLDGEKDAPDVVKIGQSILHGAVTWAPYGIGGAFVAKTAPGLAAGTGAVSGTAYLVSRADGQTDADAKLNAVLMGTLHFVFHAPQLAQEQRVAVIQGVRDAIAENTRNNNGITEGNNLHEFVGDEFIKSEAKQVLDEQNAEWLSAREEMLSKPDVAVSPEVKKPDVIEKPAGNFEDPYDPKMMDYLAQYIPPKYIVRMSGTDRLSLANSPVKDLEQYRELHKQIAAEDAQAQAQKNIPINPDIEKMISEGSPVTPVLEVTKSDTLTRKVVENVTIKVVDSYSRKDMKGTGEEQVAGDVNATGAAEKVPVAKGAEITSDTQAPAFKPETKQLEGTGDIKERGLSKSVEETAIQKGLVNDLGSLPTYRTRDMAEIAKKVETFIAKDPELAKKIALGEAQEQDGLRAQELFTGLKVKAESESDVDMLRDLALSDQASATATELGQRVKALDSGANEESPVEAIREVKKVREEVALKKSKSKSIETEKKKVAKEIEESLKKAVPTKETWASFVEALQC